MATQHTGPDDVARQHFTERVTGARPFHDKHVADALQQVEQHLAGTDERSQTNQAIVAAMGTLHARHRGDHNSARKDPDFRKLLGLSDRAKATNDPAEHRRIRSEIAILR